jgi:hypothetical protein
LFDLKLIVFFLKFGQALFSFIKITLLSVAVLNLEIELKRKLIKIKRLFIQTFFKNLLLFNRRCQVLDTIIIILLELFQLLLRRLELNMLLGEVLHQFIVLTIEFIEVVSKLVDSFVSVFFDLVDSNFVLKN